MGQRAAYELFFAAPPGLEPLLLAEAAEAGFVGLETAPGGVRARGAWRDVMRANLQLRGAARVLVRVAEKRITHLAQLDKWARGLDWPAWLRPGAHVRVEASCKRSKIYHSGAAAQRIGGALEAALKARISTGADADADADADGPIRVLLRIEKDVCALSIDTSGEPLHKRGFKQAVVKAPMRETLAALFLRACGYHGGEPVLDPMCGSGTFVLEAAERALGLAAGRARAFAFERLTPFEAADWTALKAEAATSVPSTTVPLAFIGFDRDAGAVAASRANAERGGLAGATRFETQPIGDLTRPDLPPGLVIVNPPYGARIGDAARLRKLYATLGGRLRESFGGWRVGLVTSEPTLARASGLPFLPPGPPVPHGPLKIRLFRTDPLA